MYRMFEIRQEGGRRTSLPPRLRAKVEASCGKEALGDFIHDSYLVPGRQSYGGHRYEWHGARAWGEWKPDDGADPGTKGRTWSAIVTLRNGDRNTHDIRLVAWEV